MRQTDVRHTSSLNASTMGVGHNNVESVSSLFVNSSHCSDYCTTLQIGPSRKANSNWTKIHQWIRRISYFGKKRQNLSDWNLYSDSVTCLMMIYVGDGGDVVFRWTLTRYCWWPRRTAQMIWRTVWPTTCCHSSRCQTYHYVSRLFICSLLSDDEYNDVIVRGCYCWG